MRSRAAAPPTLRLLLLVVVFASASSAGACAAPASPRGAGGAPPETSAAPVSAAVTLAPGVLDDLSQAGQLVLDDPRVSQYFHEAQRPERVPLVVAWEPGTPHPRWTKFGRPVEIFEGVPAKQPYLLPTLVSVEGGKATFNLWYEPEGALFVAELVKRAGRWSVGSIQVHERKQQ